jgi:hypothetical protein
MKQTEKVLPARAADPATYNRSLSRNLYEVAHALYERQALIAVEQFIEREEILGENFFSISYRALFNDMIAHAIKVLDEDERSATFWTLLRADETRLRRLKAYSDEKISFLKGLWEKLRIVRNKTHFHIDQLGVLDPKGVWAAADIKGNELGAGLEYLWELLTDLYQDVHGRPFPHPVKSYDGKDVLELLTYAKSKELV